MSLPCMDLEAVIITGYAKGATADKTTDVNHAWNGVNIDGNWYLLDATWGSGSVNDRQFEPKYKPYHFATPPAQFITTHFPLDAGWQLLEQNFTRAKFDRLPDIVSHFYDLGLSLNSHDYYQIQITKKTEIALKASENIIALAELTSHGQKIAQTSTLVNRQEDNLIISVAPPSAGDYKLRIYAKQKQQPGDYQEVITYQIKARQPVEQLPKVSGRFHQQQVSLIEPLTADLSPNWSTYFNLIVPEAIDVRVVNTNSKKWTPLNNYGDYFQGHVEIEPGQTVVVAKFPESDRYWHLVEYR